MAGPYFVAENWEESIRWAKKLLEKDPDNIWAHSHLASIYSFLGKDDLFYYHAKRMSVLSPLVHEAEYYKGWVLWKHGDKIKADSIFDKIVDYSNKMNKSGRNIDYYNFWLAEIFSVKGELKKSISYINKISLSFLRERWVIIFMERDPLLQNIRSDERFQKILMEAKAVWQNEHEKLILWLKQNNYLKI